MSTMLRAVTAADTAVEAPPAAEAGATSWGAIVAGALVAVATSVILLALGAGIGFAVLSPWPAQGATPKEFAATTAIWLLVTQWLSAAVGAYVTGRLRTRWTGLHTHEVFFRDTAHGLITWALATVVMALLSAGAATATLSRAAQAAEPAASHAGAEAVLGVEYELDRLMRGAPAAADAPEVRGEIGRIVAHSTEEAAGLPDSDRRYLAELVAARTGVSPAEAQSRVEVFANSVHEATTRLRAAADAARRAAAAASIYTALALLIGAFIACVAAAIGGRLRDEPA